MDALGSDKSLNFAYRSDGKSLFVFEAPIDLMSFIALYPKDWKTRNYLSLGGAGAKALDGFLSECKDMETIYSCTDSDKAGNDAVPRLLESIPEHVTVIRLILKWSTSFHTGMRISEFCGLTPKDIDLEKRIINIDHQLQRTSDMRYVIETTKTDAGTRKLPVTEDVAQMFQAIIEDRVPPKVEKVIDGYSGFLFYDENDMPLVAMHWQHRFNHMVGRYNNIYQVQMPNITPHVCRHTYCSNMAKSGMNPKTLQYLMGHSDISVTMNVYTHIGFDDAEEELKRMEEFRKAQAEIEKKNEKPVSQKMFKVI